MYYSLNHFKIRTGSIIYSFVTNSSYIVLEIYLTEILVACLNTGTQYKFERTKKFDTPIVVYENIHELFKELFTMGAPLFYEEERVTI